MINVTNVPIEQIELDVDNPRVKHFKELHGEVFSEGHMLMALGADAPDEEGADSKGSYNKLKKSIEASGGIIQPVLLKSLGEGGDRYRCIEGNTRVAIYRELSEESSDEANRGEKWASIPAIVNDSMDEYEAHKIRLQIHLVGVREWDPHAKSKYLYELSEHGKMPMNELVAFCGGSARDVQLSIQAYKDMEQFYRPILEEEDEFDPSRFSAFVELQRGGVKEALYDAGFNEFDFSKWVSDLRIKPLNTIRKLPAILKDPEATKILLKNGSKQAMIAVEARSIAPGLNDYDISQLAKALMQRLDTLPNARLAKIANGEQQEMQDDLRDLSECLNDLLTSTASGWGEEN